MLYPQAQAQEIPLYGGQQLVDPSVAPAYHNPGIFAGQHGAVARTPGIGQMDTTSRSPAFYVWSALSLVGAATGAYHGYKRNDSVGWAIGWFLLGGMFPVITIPVSIAQGFGEPHYKTVEVK